MMKHRTTSLSFALAALVFSAAGCGSTAKTASTVASSTAVTTAPTTAVPTGVAVTTVPDSTAAPTVQLVKSTLGTILANAKGATLYVFAKDSGDKSACSGGCAAAWPALTGPATPGTGLDAQDFATITRDDGTQQITFYGHPLYTYAGDAVPGDVTGQGSNGVWHVVGADGTPIETAAPVPGY